MSERLEVVSREVGRGTFLREEPRPHEPDAGDGASGHAAGPDAVAEQYSGPGGLRPGRTPLCAGRS